MFSKLRIAAIVLLTGIFTILLLPVQLLLILVRPQSAHYIPQLWHRFVLFLMGVRIKIVGAPTKKRPLMLAANHVSWSDIPVLGSVVPCTFIAKDEMADWAIFGWLAKLQRTVFVARNERRSVGKQANQIADRMMADEALVLFPEGTTGCGNFILPFKSSLFGAPQSVAKLSETDAVFVQPVAIVYTRIHGMPIGRYLMPQAAWPGDIELMPHLSNFLRKGAFDVEVHFGEPVPFEPHTNRKDFCREIETSVRTMVVASQRGRASQSPV